VHITVKHAQNPGKIGVQHLFKQILDSKLNLPCFNLMHTFLALDLHRHCKKIFISCNNGFDYIGPHLLLEGSSPHCLYKSLTPSFFFFKFMCWCPVGFLMTATANWKKTHHCWIVATAVLISWHELYLQKQYNLCNTTCIICCMCWNTVNMLSAHSWVSAQ